MIGILLLDKPPGPTSHDAVARVRRATGVRRVGHFGTLDPFASGLLVLGIGAATRLAPYASSHRKTYRAAVRLGARSSTDDREGEIELVDGVTPPDHDAVAAACARWMGMVEQVPPVYSAKHVAGRRAYARARAGQTVILHPVRVTIERIDILRYEWPILEIEVDCGPGTYIRALARDLGEELDTGGYCDALRRTRSGPFEVGAALAWPVLDEPERLRSALRSAESAVADLPVLTLDEAGALAAGQGRAVVAPGSSEPAGPVRITGPRGFIGIGHARSESPGSWRVQPRAVLFPEGEDES